VSKDDRPKGPYTVWVYYGCEGWAPTDYSTLEEALMHQRYGGRCVIQNPVQYKVVEKEIADGHATACDDPS
jgi:hypothetical protein